jgi:phage shock protein C
MEQEKPTGMTGPPFETSGQASSPVRSRRLYRSRQDRIVAGVCGGLGHYFNVEPVLVRIGFVALTFAGGAGILVYLLAAILIPQATAEEDFARADATSVSQGRLVFGGLLIVVGAYLLVREFMPGFSDQIIWASVLIAIGLAVVLKGVQR